MSDPTQPTAPIDLTIGPGDFVRSYDFVGRDDSYAEGVVKRITEPLQGCPRYEIEVERRVFGAEVDPGPHENVLPPVNGTLSLFGGETRGVVKVERPGPDVTPPPSPRPR